MSFLCNVAWAECKCVFKICPKCEQVSDRDMAKYLKENSLYNPNNHSEEYYLVLHLLHMSFL